MPGQEYVWVVHYRKYSTYEHQKVFTNKVKALEFKYKMWDQGYRALLEKSLINLLKNTKLYCII